jgi:N-acetylglutamate synthase-like GNAT family acetyltransferase
MKLRAARDGDATELAALVARCNARYGDWASAGWEPPESPFEDERPRIAERIADPSAWVRLAQEAEAIAGFVDWRPDRADPTVAELRSLYVEPDRWDHGLGRGLLRAAQGAIGEAGLETAYLWVPDGDRRAMGLYESEGWRASGSTRWHDRLRLPMHRYELEVSGSSAATMA